MMRSRASAYFRCFSSRSRAARLWRSAKDSAARLRSSSSLSSSSAAPAAAEEAPRPATATLGVGFRLSTLTCGLKSLFNGTSFLVSRKNDRSGCSAASHSFLLASACATLRCVRLRTVGAGAVATGPDCESVIACPQAHGISLQHTSTESSQSSSQALGTLLMTLARCRPAIP